MKERKTLLFAVMKFFILMRSSDSSSNSTDIYRRMLHQPLFPEVTTPPLVMQAPPPPLGVDMPFFPEVPTGKSPDNVQTPTTPSNIPSSTPSTFPVKSPSNQTKKAAFALSSSIAVLIMVSALGFFWYRHRFRVRTPSKTLFDQDSDQRPTERNGNSSGSGLIYLGTMDPTTTTRHGGSNRSPYHKLSSIQRSEMMRPSPELRPLPPLPPLDSRQMTSRFYQETFYPPNESAAELDSSDSSYTPNQISSISSTSMSTTVATASKGRFIHSCRSTPNYRRVSPKTRLWKSSTEPKSGIGPECREEIQSTFFPPKIPLSSSSPQSVIDSSSKPVNSNELVSQLKKSDILLTQRGENQSDITQSEAFLLASTKNNQKLSPSCSEIRDHLNPDSKKSDNPPLPVAAVTPPPPPPPPPPLPPSMAGKTKSTGKFISQFPPLTRPQFAEKPFTGIQVEKNPPETEHYGKEHSESTEAPANEDILKPRLKSLHWDKVRASSDRSMVWDQLQSSSFQLNEDMIESLFICNSTTPVQKEPNRRHVPLQTQQNRVLDPKKSQNIAILLRALNVTREEVTEALLDGNPESLGSDLFETLVKMAPTKEEEVKLRDYNGDISKLGSAERFLKAILDVPCAFQRVDAMMYRSSFDAEVQYLRKSFESLEAACNELKNSQLFLKILETVLWTGNRINIGTNRGEAKAFKLDTLLKLADVKGTDGKTSLLHFVVQEIIKSEDLKTNTESKDNTLKTSGLRVISSLSNELNNVKKAASMDSNVLNSYIMKLESGLEKIKLFILSNPSSTEGKFFETMKEFIKMAEQGIIEIRHEESRTLSHVKEVTEYFHGDTAREEAHPLRIFMVVRDFLSVLDRVSKEVGKLQEKPMIGSARSFQASTNNPLPLFNRYNSKEETSSEEG